MTNTSNELILELRKVAVKVCYCLIILCFVFAQVGLSQNLDEAEFVSYSTSDGLSDGNIQAIYEDSRGYMWFGTYNGVNRFNGYEFNSYLSDSKDSTTLSHRQVNAILEDEFKHLWIATNVGLNLYDVEKDNFIRIGLVGLQGERLAPPIVNMCIDKSNTLWAMSNDALYQISLKDRSGDQLSIDAVYATKDMFNTSTVQFQSIALDAADNLWVVSSRNELSCIRRTRSKSEIINVNAKADTSVGRCKFLAYDKFLHSLFISTHDAGLIVYSIKYNTFQFYNESNTNGMFNNLNVPFIASENICYLPTDGKGLIVFNKVNRTCKRVTVSNYSPFPTNLNSISKVFRDSRGNLWIGSSNNKGVMLYAPYRNKVKKFLTIGDLNNAVDNNQVVSFYQDRLKTLWIGTDGAGLARWDEQKDKLIRDKTLRNDKVLFVTGDKKDNLWLACFDGGVSKYNPVTKKIFNHIEHASAAEKELYNWPYHLLNDNKDRLWVAFLRGGLGYYDKKSNKIFSYRLSGEEPYTFISDYPTHLYQDSKNNIWVCTYNGIAYFNPDEVDFSQPHPKIHFSFLLSKSRENSISSNEISSIVEDKNGIYWIGNLNNGLDRYDAQKGTFKNYSIKDGLPGNSIKGLIRDNNNDVWIFTDKGVAKLNPDDMTFKTFDVNDGLLNMNMTGKPYINNKGEIFFGANNGFNKVDSLGIKVNPHKPNVYIGGLRVYGKAVDIGEEINGRKILERHISVLDEIEVSYKEDFFAIEFFAIEFNMPKKIQYRYKLAGFDRDWVDAGNKREAVYTNLNPGTYTFMVKASNNDGLWTDEPARIKLIIIPPWWETWSFKVSVTGSFVGLIFAFYLWRIKTLKHQQRLLELTVAERTSRLREANFRLNEKNDEIVKHQSAILNQNEALTAQKLELERFAKELDEASQAKIRFFTNVSHEFRTPLSLILGPVESLIAQVKDEGVKNQLNLIYRNAKRLLRLINQLLDMRRLENGTVRLNVANGEIISFIKDIFDSFGYLAKRHKIKYTFFTNVESFHTRFDPDILEKILYNLLSNSFKFTPDGKSISLEIHKVSDKAFNHDDKEDRDTLVLIVKDNGVGIPQENLPFIFDQFYRVEGSNVRRSSGSGIGLSLTKELTEVHNGKINVESTLGEGSAFTVTLGLEKHRGEALKTINCPADTAVDKYPHITQGVMDFNTFLNITNVQRDPSKKMILFADDNVDIATYISLNLSKEYNLVIAPNGAIAEEKAYEYIPDIIISDVMMPVMDGIEFTKKMKADVRTSHIPIILLTARTEENAQIEGLKLGADDYITKPFNIEVLKAKVINFLIIRQRMIEKYKTDIDNDIKILADSPTDEGFLIKANQIIEENISNSNFNAMEFGRELGMSRAQLYRKIQSLTNQSVNEFIRSIRLKKAAKILLVSKPSISELAYGLGFSSPQYFTRCFKAEFGVSPTEFMEKH